jgi:type IV pilus assembly protein PilN
MRFTANLATRIYVNARQVNLVFGVLAGVLLLALVLLIWVNASYTGDARRLERELAGLEARFKASGGGLSEKEYQALLTRIKAANGIIKRKSFNWTGLLDWLEVVLPEGVMVTSLDPSLKEGQLTLSGVATSFSALRKLLENLEDSKFFTDIYLMNQADIKVDEAQKGISFTVVCKADVNKL